MVHELFKVEILEWIKHESEPQRLATGRCGPGDLHFSGCHLRRNRTDNWVFVAMHRIGHHGGGIVTPRQQIKHEIRHLTRPIGIALVLVVAAIIGWGFAMRTLHVHLKEVQHARPTG